MIDYIIQTRFHKSVSWIKNEKVAREKKTPIGQYNRNLASGAKAYSKYMKPFQ